VTLLPIVLLAAPVIRRMVDYLSRDQTAG
jgi:hypothetical protein